MEPLFHFDGISYDPDDLLVLNPLEPKFKGKCGCEYDGHGHKGMCGIEVERNAVPSRGYYMCSDCDRLIRNERERTRK